MIKICPFCNTLNDGASEFCKECSFELSAESGAIEVEEHSSDIAGSDSTQYSSIISMISRFIGLVSLLAFIFFVQFSCSIFGGSLGVTGFDILFTKGANESGLGLLISLSWIIFCAACAAIVFRIGHIIFGAVGLASYIILMIFLKSKAELPLTFQIGALVTIIGFIGLVITGWLFDNEPYESFSDTSV